MVQRRICIKSNKKRGIVQSYKSEKSRYVVLLDDEDIRIMVKEENLSLEILNEDNDEDDESLLQVD